VSDLSDKCAESADVVSAAGGVFARSPSRARERAGGALGARLACACGGRPVYRVYPVHILGRQAETLGCEACGSRVGPLSSRQALAVAWRLSAPVVVKHEEVQHAITH
jgi:hypothetical protein